MSPNTEALMASSAPRPPKIEISARVHKSTVASRYIGVSDSLLKKMRMNGEGPRWIVLSDNRIGYLQSDLDDWINSRPKMPATAEKKAA